MEVELDAQATISDHDAEELEHLHHEVEQAHLSYLSYRVSGITILLMSIAYATFIGIGGFLNASKPKANHDDDHDEHEHHGSASPIIFAFGIMIFLAGFPDFVVACKAMLSADLTPDFAMLSLSLVGLFTIVIAVSNWWFEDLPFDGHGEQIATSYPFEGEHIRKAGLWVFIMSEIMVFATFFSSYLRMRTEWCTDWAIRDGVEACKDVPEGTVVTASDLLRYDFATILPGAINTFALIISSYTIVLALKTAKNAKWEAPSGLMGKLMPTRKAAVRNYLIATLLLGSLFIVLKLVEWSHLVAEGFDIGTVQGSIFYVATGAHGLHVFIGLLVMLYLIFKADTVGYDENNAQGIEYFGLYWHFVDLAWVVIFPAFYLY
jgi:cytochrome c oxidase subunit I+III